MQNINEIKKALDLYYEEYGVYPERLTTEQLTYLKKIPKCPSAGKDYIYQLNEDRTKFVLRCVTPDRHKLKDICATNEHKAVVIE